MEPYSLMQENLPLSLFTQREKIEIFGAVYKNSLPDIKGQDFKRCRN
jgi:hypothetical protein